MPFTNAPRPILDREHHGARAHMEVFGSDVRLQRDRARQELADAWQRIAELEAALADTCFVIEALRTQMASWKIEPAVNDVGIEQSARTLLAKRPA